MENMGMNNTQFWKNKKVLITGHTGFKGSWLCLWLKKIGANVCGIALAPNTEMNLFTKANIAENMQSIMLDVRDLNALINIFETFSPEIVIHLAAQSLVRSSYEDPVTTYTSNVIGTVNLLEAVRHSKSVRAVINVTSDKCYENHEWAWGYRETDALGGRDPYSSSKACSELVTSAYRSSYFTQSKIGIASARAGNVIGGGDWAQDRLVPDFVRACLAGKALSIRYPQAQRPWQHVLESLSGYLLLAEKLFTHPDNFSQAWNFGPDLSDTKTVQWVVEELKILWGKKAASSIMNDQCMPHEAHSLKLDCNKSKTLLGWEAVWSIQRALQATVAWHLADQKGEDMHAFSLNQINEYEGSLNLKNRV
jgi:CDP-glucose 4,6-dehydratase